MNELVQTDPYGNKLYRTQQYPIEADKIVRVTARGYRRYSKPALVSKEQ